MDDDLRRLGEALETAISREIAGAAARGNLEAHPDHGGGVADPQEPAMTARTPTRHRSRRPRRVMLGVTVGGLLLVGAGTAVAVSHLSGDDVAQGLPGGSILFTGTGPSCTTTDGVVFECTLSSEPTAEVQDDWTGAAELFVDGDKHIAGGCRGLDRQGLHWTCYVGQRAVDEQILAADLLSQYAPEPGRG